MSGETVTGSNGVPVAASAGPRMSVLHDAVASVDARSAGATDAVRACTLTLVALVAWVITPPLTVLLLSTVGLVGVLRAHRAGGDAGHCTLGRPKLIVGYLGAAWLLGAWFTAAEVSQLLG